MEPSNKTPHTKGRFTGLVPIKRTKLDNRYQNNGPRMKNRTKITRNAISARRSRNPSAILSHPLVNQVNLGYGVKLSGETACIIEMRGLYALIRQTRQAF
jgi:hypothetical protein